MSDWGSRQITVGALLSVALCAAGVGLIIAAIVGALEHPWASLGTVLFMTGCLQVVLAAIRHQGRRVSDAFDLGQEAASLRMMRK